MVWKAKGVIMCPRRFLFGLILYRWIGLGCVVPDETVTELFVPQWPGWEVLCT